MAANEDPAVLRRRLGAELRRLRLVSGLTSAQVAEQLMISKPKMSNLENGHRTIKPRDVRDLCRLYGVTDDQAVDALMRQARQSGRHGGTGMSPPSGLARPRAPRPGPEG